MNDKEFRDAVYQKYEKYQCSKENEFIKKSFQKSTQPILMIVFLLALLSIFVLGTAAATHYFSNVWKEPEQYDYNEELDITDEMIEDTISEENVLKKATDTLAEIQEKAETIISHKLVHDPSQNKTSWEIETEQGSFLYFNGETGKLEHFSAADLRKEYGKANRDDAKTVGKLLMDNLGYEQGEDAFVELIDDGGGRWWMECYGTYDGVMNPYQGVRLLFSPSAKEILLLHVFDEPFENNPYIVSQSEAIYIINNYLGEENIQEVIAEKAIEKMNTILFQKENEGSYRTEPIIRNIWKVTVKLKENGYTEQFYVDGTTGELIGGDQVK